MMVKINYRFLFHIILVFVIFVGQKMYKKNLKQIISQRKRVTATVLPVGLSRFIKNFKKKKS